MARNIVVDGSNIATEGRDAPSLAQLREAVAALAKEHPGARISVVVDATFGHRIAKRDVAEFNRAIEANEMVCPPAGAVGRGDAFILAIAEKVNGAVLSNDSFQEFHARHKWLFEAGRLIGGKPVPHVGWIFVERTPVRGPVSTRATRAARTTEKPVPEKGPAPSTRAVPSTRTSAVRALAVRAPAGRTPAAGRGGQTNELMPYLAFVEKHPIGTKVRAVVTAYAANGVSVGIGEIHGYVPIRALASPPPRSARDVFRIGDQAPFVITGYSASRRSVDLAVPGVVAIPDATEKAPVTRRPAKKSAARKGPAAAPPAKKAAVRPQPVTKKTAAKQATVKKTTAKKTPAIKKAAAKKTPATKKAVAKKTPAKNASTRSSSTPTTRRGGRNR